jgi:hypothetical protein
VKFKNQKSQEEDVFDLRAIIESSDDAILTKDLNAWGCPIASGTATNRGKARSRLRGIWLDGRLIASPFSAEIPT